jgi:arabinogalactan oligomer/maltooligosaccharide transport system substrate-binding protein
MRARSTLLRTAALVSAVGLGSGTSPMVQAHTTARQYSSDVPPKLRKDITVRLLYMSETPASCADAPCRQAVREWQQRTGDHVVVETGGNATTFCLDAPKSGAPDVIVDPGNGVGQQVACNAIAPVPSWAWPPSARRQYSARAVQEATIRGKIFMMPNFCGTTGILYNTAMVSPRLFKPLKGDRYPRWDTLIKKARSLTTGGILGYVQPFEIYYDYAFIRAFGGYIFANTKKGFDYRDIGLATPGAIRGFQFLKDLSTNGKYGLVPPTMDQSREEQLFAQGRAAMMLDGIWGAPAGTNIHYGFALLPSIDGIHPMRQFAGCDAYGVNAYSPHQNEAFSLVAYLSRREQQLHDPNNPLAFFPAAVPAIKSLARRNLTSRDAIVRGVAAAVATGDPMPAIPEMQFVWAPVDAAIGDLVNGRQTPQAAAQAAVVQIQAAIAKLHSG